MRYIPFLGLLLISVSTATGQGFSSSEPVKIIDSGGMYTTFKWDKAAEAELRTALGAEMASAVLNSSNETVWPKGIASFNNRQINKAKFEDYQAFYLTTINHKMAVLFVPAAENSAMPDDMRPAKDIYFLIEEKGLTKRAVPAKIPEGDFAAELNVITNGFRNGFVDLMSDEVREATDQTTKLTGCKVDLEEAYQMFFYKDLASGQTAFRAAFPGNADLDLALLGYQRIIRKIDALSLDCGPLQKNNEVVNGPEHSQTYQVADGDFSYDKVYEKMVIQVTIEPVEVFDDEGDAVTEWAAVLYIYEQ